MLESTIFLCALLLCLHELDAIYRKEWTILPFLNRIQGEKAAILFIVLHLPYIGAILYSLTPSASSSYQIGISAFAVLHAALHFFWPRTENYGFDNLLSRIWIWGAASTGAANILFQFFGNEK